jgi:hypothetical protein
MNMDCRFTMIAYKHNNIKLNDILVAAGISNRLIRLKYGGSNICCLEGCGNRDPADDYDKNWPLTIFDRFSIPYELIDPDALFSQDNFNNIVLFIPKELARNYTQINPYVKQLFVFYSTFYVFDYNKNELIFRLNEDDENYIFSKKSFEILESIPTTPFRQPFYIMKLLDRNFSLTTAKILSNLRENINIFLGESQGNYNNFQYISGWKMYNELIAVLTDFCDRGPILSNKDRLELNFTIVSIISGSVGFYRQDFSDALLIFLNQQDNNSEWYTKVISDLELSSRSWREIGRILYKIQTEQIALDKDALTSINSLIKELELLEMGAMEQLGKMLE